MDVNSKKPMIAVFICDNTIEINLNVKLIIGMKGSFFGNRDVLVPTNEAEMDQHCRYVSLKSLCCLLNKIYLI